MCSVHWAPSKNRSWGRCHGSTSHPRPGAPSAAASTWASTVMGLEPAFVTFMLTQFVPGGQIDQLRIEITALERESLALLAVPDPLGLITRVSPDHDGNRRSDGG